MVLGPAIDPPHLQHTYRPDGVHRRPDERYGCDGRTVYEVWIRGRCVCVSSIEDSEAGAGTEAAFWAWYDERSDPRMAVNSRQPLRPIPRHLRSI